MTKIHSPTSLCMLCSFYRNLWYLTNWKKRWKCCNTSFTFADYFINSTSLLVCVEVEIRLVHIFHYRSNFPIYTCISNTIFLYTLSVARVAAYFWQKCRSSTKIQNVAHQVTRIFIIAMVNVRRLFMTSCQPRCQILWKWRFVDV